MNDKTFKVVDSILAELERAEEKHPHWPDDIIHAVSIMNEEAGESIRAALNHYYADEKISEVKKELIQTAAMCLRCLINIKE